MVLAGNITFQSSSLNRNWSELATSIDANKSQNGVKYYTEKCDMWCNFVIKTNLKKNTCKPACPTLDIVLAFY